MLFSILQAFFGNFVFLFSTLIPPVQRFNLITLNNFPLPIDIAEYGLGRWIA